MSRSAGAPGRLAAIARLLCPRCRRGAVFRGFVAMREICPACGHRFEREPGFFLGAMYVSYALAVPAYGLIVILIIFLRPSWPETTAFAAALLPFLPLVPPIFRYSRAIWMHLDWILDPGTE